MKAKKKKRSVPEQRPTLVLAVRVPKWVHDAAKTECKSTGYTMTVVVRRWLEEYLTSDHWDNDSVENT